MGKWINLDDLPSGRVEWDDIFDAPSIDIVRCKECKHWDTADGECYADRGIYFPNADDYCSYGQKGDENVETD